MRLPGSWMRDGLLLLLAAATVTGAGYVVTRTPEPPATSIEQLRPRPSPSPSPTVAPVRALVLGPDAGAEVLADQLATELGWRVDAAVLDGAGYVTAGQGGTYADLVPAAVTASNADVVLILSSTAPTEEADPRRLGGNAQFVVAAVRDALPGSRTVLVGPLSADPEAFLVQRDMLTGVAARFGAVFVDPVGGRYLGDPTASPAPDAAAAVAARLAADLRRVLPATLVPTATPTP